MKKLSMNDRIKKAGIKIEGVFISKGENLGFWTLDGKIRGAYLVYNGKKIVRPNYEKCPEVVKREFNLSI